MARLPSAEPMERARPPGPGGGTDRRLRRGLLRRSCRGAAHRRRASDHATLQALGPDLLSPDFDLARARQRLRVDDDAEIGDALLDQTALAGIGNVYKSEVLFLCGVSPFRPVAGLEDERLDRVVATAAALMKRNLGAGERRTTSGLTPEPLWVYERGGRPCRRCGTTIERRAQGALARSTWWCPRCQT